KFLMYESSLIPIGQKNHLEPFTLQDRDFDKVKTDVNAGLKGFYEVTFQKDETSLSGILAQYPFSYAHADVPASLVFLVPVRGLTSGIYRTYFYLFLGVVILLIGTVSFFIVSIKWNRDSIKVQEDNLKEISRLFDQQNLLLQEMKGFVFFHDYRGEITKAS